MPNLEKEIQERFFDNIINQKQSFESSPISIYQKLVFQRYEEVLKNAFPLFLNEIEKELFDESIKAFMKDTPSTAFLWKVPKDYIKFVKKNLLFDKKEYLYELLFFDWIEIELYMKEYKLKEDEKFTYKNSYKLSESARVRRFKYDIINKNYKEKRENFLVIYYDFQTHDIVYREINQLIFELLKNIDKKGSLKDTLRRLCLKNDIAYKEAKKLLQEPLEELFLKKVFI